MLLKLLTAQGSRPLSLQPPERSLIIRWHPMSHRQMPNKSRAQADNPYRARLRGGRAPLLKGMEVRRGRRALREGVRTTVLYSKTNRRSLGNTTSHRAYPHKRKLMKTLHRPVRILTACIRPLFRKNQTRTRTITTTQSRAQAPLTSTIPTTIVCNQGIVLEVAPASIRVPLTLADPMTSQLTSNNNSNSNSLKTRTSRLTSRNLSL